MYLGDPGGTIPPVAAYANWPGMVGINGYRFAVRVLSGLGSGGGPNKLDAVNPLFSKKEDSMPLSEDLFA
tara:strand:- start:29 stop:238 length:210 start_codon:yes stop_codon:yes gene_type:complete